VEASLAKSILTGAPMGVIAIGLDGRIHSANATACRLFDRSLMDDPPVDVRAVLPTLPLSELSEDGDFDGFNARGRSGGGLRHFESTRPDGSKLAIDVQAARFSVRGDDYITLFLQDYTAVIAGEAALQELRQQIVHRWRLNSLGEMAAMVAHELNQPLAAMGNYLHVAKSALADPDGQQRARHAIVAAEEQATRASDTIRHMRSMLAHDMGFHTDCRATDLVGELMPLIAIQGREVEADIAVDLPADEWVRCDKVQIQQLIMNLTRNGLEAVKGQAVRTVVLSGAVASESMLELRVTDSGPGIPAELAEKLFQPLSSSKAEGMGLGLSICKTIVNAHGGTIQYAPGQQGGAVFSFTVPRAAAPAP